MAYNTGNPIGSLDPRDAADNKENFERFALSTERTYTDRLGVQRKTVTGTLQDYAAYNSRGVWTTATAYNVNDVWRDGAAGAFYLVLADYTSGASAAADIAGGNVAVHQPKDWVVSVATIADLRLLEPAFDGQQVCVKEYRAGADTGAMVFAWDESRPKSDHDGGTVIDPSRTYPESWDVSGIAGVEDWLSVQGTAGSGCWVLQHSGVLTTANFGDAATDTDVDHYSVSRAIKVSAALGAKLVLLPGVRKVSQVEVPSNSRIYGYGATVKRISNYGLILGVFYSNPQNIHIEGIAFDNNASATSHTHKWSIRMGNAKNVTLKNCRFFNGYDAAIKANGPDGLYIRTDAPEEVNNIVVDGCTFEGFTRNGCSVTDGVNTILFDNCTFRSNGLTGLDIEANIGTETLARNVTINRCTFEDNGDDENSGFATDRTGHLGIFSASPAAFHSENVTVSNCVFKTITAIKSTGIFAIRANSFKNLRVFGNEFYVPDSYVAANSAGASLIFEEGTYGSDGLWFEDNSVSNHNIQSFSLKNGNIAKNKIYGSWSTLSVGSASSRNNMISHNDFIDCGDSSQSIVTISGSFISAKNNEFVENRVSGAPANVFTIVPSASTNRRNITISNNKTFAANTARWARFVSSDYPSGLPLLNVEIERNYISSVTGSGIYIRNSLAYPAISYLKVNGNQFNNGGTACIDIYRGTIVEVSGNFCSQSSGLTRTIRLSSCGPSVVTENMAIWSGADAPTLFLLVEAPQDTNMMIVKNNVSKGITGGNFFDTGTGITTDNIVG